MQEAKLFDMQEKLSDKIKCIPLSLRGNIARGIQILGRYQEVLADFSHDRIDIPTAGLPLQSLLKEEALEMLVLGWHYDTQHDLWSFSFDTTTVVRPL